MCQRLRPSAEEAWRRPAVSLPAGVCLQPVGRPGRGSLGPYYLTGAVRKGRGIISTDNDEGRCSEGYAGDSNSWMSTPSHKPTILLVVAVVLGKPLLGHPICTVQMVIVCAQPKPCRQGHVKVSESGIVQTSKNSPALYQSSGVVDQVS